jgi:Cof subfamily protein (haloacid dehalogenase superfamily)
MIGTELRPTPRLAAIDLDGTLLGPDGRISAENHRAVQRLQAAGAQVVLASGRHFNSMRKYTDSLPGMQWVVSCQGGEVSDVRRELVLNRVFMPVACVQEMFDLGRSLGLTAIVYAVEGVFTEHGQTSGLEFYTHLAGQAPRQIPAREFLEQPIFKVIWVGTAGPDIDQARAQFNGTAAGLQVVRTHTRLLEFMPAGVSKASALKVLAERLAITPAEVLAFGDGDNDVPMFEWAGRSVAMPHGWPAAIRHASHTAPPGPPETAFARGVDLIFDTVLNQADGRKRVTVAQTS